MLTKKFSAVIFSDTYENNRLTRLRAISALPFAARFCLVDFILSSLVNAGVANIYVITNKSCPLLEKHLSGGRYWDLNHRNSGLKILPTGFIARDMADALGCVKQSLRAVKEEYVVLCSANLIANIDFENVFDFHVRSKADVTLVYSDSHLQKQKLGIYVMKRSLLLDIIEHGHLPGYAKTAEYTHYEYSRSVFSLRDYYDANMDMLDKEKRNQLFNENRPVMTNINDSIPVLYRYNARVENSLIADGCEIDGTVRNSILFRNVSVKTGAVIENSIIMQNGIIGRDCIIKNVVADENLWATDGKEIYGVADYPFLIQNDTVM